MDDDDGLEPEVLTYGEFKKRQALSAWRQRWRAHEAEQNEKSAWAGVPRGPQNRYRSESSAPAAEA